MHRRRLTVTALALLAAVVGLPPLGACAVRASHEVPRGLVRATVDTIAAHFVALEVQRLSAEAAGMAEDNPLRRGLELRVGALRDQIRELPDPAPAERVVLRHLLDALDARQASLAVRRRQLSVSLSPDNPIVQQAEAEARVVERRRAELRATLGEAREATAPRR
jgi:hypothetical protein